MTRSRLHEDDFIEMLERGDSIEKIAAYAGITGAAVTRRFGRLPDEVKGQIMAKRKTPLGRARK